LETVYDVGRIGFDRPSHAEGAVIHVAARAAGDLGELARRQLPMRLPVELARAGKGNVIDVEVETHADGVGGHQKIDIARLVERDLRIAGARGEGAEHDGGAAALTADEFGDGVDLRGGERDDGTARRQPRYLLLAGVGELGKARARDEIGARNELA